MSWLRWLRIVIKNNEKWNPFRHFRSLRPSTRSVVLVLLFVGGGDWLCAYLPLNKGQAGQAPP